MLTDTVRSIALFLPKALAFVGILVLGWLAARAVRMLTDKVLERVSFDRLAERGGVAAFLARGRYDASDLVARLVYYAVLLFTLQLAFGIWGPNPVSDVINAVVSWLPQAFVAILIIVVVSGIASWVKDIVSSALAGLSYGRTLANVASVFIIGLGVIAALNQVGIATSVTTPILITFLATVGGILIVGVGGGLIRPMQARWEGMLQRVQTESGRVAEHARAYTAGQADATQLIGQRTSTVYQSPTATAEPEPPVFLEQAMAAGDESAQADVDAVAVGDDVTQKLRMPDDGHRGR
ncbi:hypothetical protein Cs7R123_46150 [Catellatospora sp. TT07R-123]|nr:hypothetical protein Cs7R123_46150 [Catellatospora sp. TT07R-123]